MSQPIVVTALYTYPVKSCAGIAHEQVTLTATGPAYDRRWMLGYDDSERVLSQITQRDVPKLALVQPTITDDCLILSAPGKRDLSIPLQDRALKMSHISIWSDTVRAHDEGDEAAEWFSDFLNVDMRLMRMPDDYVRRVDPRYSPEPAQASFTDAYPLLLISEASLEDLNEKMMARGKPALPMNRFRPNVVVAGCEPFAEDEWRHITIGGVPCEGVKRCARCVTTTVDQRRGEVADKDEPLATLATYRKAQRGVMFGQNVVHRGLGTLHVGDTVQITTQA
jgi:uncharacterized protein YcbX